MSYIRAKLVDVDTDTTTADVVDQHHGTPSIDCNLDDEMLDFVLALIAKVNDLREDEALIVWKEIF
jgi:hypothetical protein